MAHGTRAQLISMATQAAWNAVKALEQPGTMEPALEQIQTACRNARVVAEICDRLSLDDLLVHDDDQEEDDWTHAGWVLPPND